MSLVKGMAIVMDMVTEAADVKAGYLIYEALSVQAERAEQAK